jgi:hypothetical protein
MAIQWRPSASNSVRFLGDMHAAWLERGRAVIDRVIVERPELFLQAMVKLAQGHRVELGQPRKFHEPRTYEQILQQLEDRAGPAARKLFETFLRKMRRLEAEHQGMPAE